MQFITGRDTSQHFHFKTYAYWARHASETRSTFVAPGFDSGGMWVQIRSLYVIPETQLLQQPPTPPHPPTPHRAHSCPVLLFRAKGMLTPPLFQSWQVFSESDCSLREFENAFENQFYVANAERGVCGLRRNLKQKDPAKMFIATTLRKLLH